MPCAATSSMPSSHAARLNSDFLFIIGPKFFLKIRLVFMHLSFRPCVPHRFQVLVPWTWIPLPLATFSGKSGHRFDFFFIEGLAINHKDFVRKWGRVGEVVRNCASACDATTWLDTESPPVPLMGHNDSTKWMKCRLCIL